MKTYRIKEAWITLQGEGARAGSKSVFVRFSGCDLWNGREEDRSKGKGLCRAWCDTDFVGGEKYDLTRLRDVMYQLWGSQGSMTGQKWCVLTGGEPSLQIDQALVDALHTDGWMIAVETNGCTDNDAVRSCDHICLSPKRGTDWKALGKAHEIKVVLPGAAPGEEGWTDAELEAIEFEIGFSAFRPQFFVQPQDPGAYIKLGSTPAYQPSVQQCIDFVMAHPSWRISTQQHKVWGVR